MKSVRACVRACVCVREREGCCIACIYLALLCAIIQRFRGCKGCNKPISSTIFNFNKIVIGMNIDSNTPDS